MPFLSFAMSIVSPEKGWAHATDATSDTETISQRLTLLLVIDIQVLQNCCGSRDAILIVAMSHGDAGDHHRDSRRFRPIELRLFQIDVVDNFSDRAKCWVVQAHAVDQDFERA